ncbi:MAG: hypothetical protein LBH51_10175, partial [Treponema sp.]|nr:hypothetical protein [Treponema sp.]
MEKPVRLPLPPPVLRAALIIAALFCCSCHKKAELRLAPPSTPPLSREEVGYGVGHVSYTHVVDKPDSRGLSLGYLRRGSVVRVLERRIAGQDGAPEWWALVEGRGGMSLDSRGWLPESA